jgi:hypothetical protein
MKAKIISCGILAAVLTTAAFAQHARLSSGGTVPAARMPNAVTATPSSPGASIGHAGIAPNAGMDTNAGVRPTVDVGHDGVAPNASTTSTIKTKKPKSVAKPAPDTREFGNRTATTF